MKNVVVVGAGLSGLTCSVKAMKNDVIIHLFSPEVSEQSQSVMAMGGINAALNTKGQNDSTYEHYNDTINGGQDINNHLAVKKLTDDAPEIIGWLSTIGCSFTRDDEKNVDLRYFGGQKKMRTAYAGARTGKQLVTAINSQCRKGEFEKKIVRHIGWRFLSLLLSADKKECCGVIMFNENTQEIKEFYADCVVIATGGLNKLFGKISGSIHNDGCTTGNLLEQGVVLVNLEMIQYHPTTIETPVKRMLITEAARGEGGRLYTIKDGKKWYFMEEWYPKFGALMPRDVVSRSIYKVCNDYNLGIDGENKVYLDISHLPEETVKEKLDEVYEVCTRYLNLDPTVEAIPVYPGVHYFMGGILTDDCHKTNIKRLFAIGECSCQYHGANRLGGNSLLGAVHGGWVVADEISNLEKQDMDSTEECERELERQIRKYEKWQKTQNNEISLYDFETELAEIMNKSLGIYREEKELIKALNDIKELKKQLTNVNVYENYYAFVTLESLLNLAQAMIMSAINRKESRGAHQRKDYPERDDEKYGKVTAVRSDEENYHISFEDTEKRMDW